MNRLPVFGPVVLALAVAAGASPAQAPDPRVREAEARRIAVIQKAAPAVIAVCKNGGQPMGSGVLISADGYALTNFHVVQVTGPVHQCGLPDGNLYDSVVVGIDRVGDVALIKLLPNKEGTPFPFAPLGDSDKVQMGDWTLAMGNPFSLSTDFTPTVTYGLVSGTHRYQYPEGGGLLEYTDCIQVDTSINPGNSGGPLFNMSGEVIGINGRIMFEKRVRINSGVGFAISINQIKNFLGHLRTGHDVDHATLGAAVGSEMDEVGFRQLTVRSILEDSDAFRRGLDTGDELVSFAGRPMLSVNQFKNVLGIYPKGWRLPLVYRRENQRKEILVRLRGSLPKAFADGSSRPAPNRRRPDQPQPQPQPQKPPETPASKLYEPKSGFVNHYFNKLERDRLLGGFRKHGDFAPVAGDWHIEGDLLLEKKEKVAGRVAITDVAEPGGKNTKTACEIVLGGGKFGLEPLKTGLESQDLRQPAGSGLLLALYHYRRLLTLGEKGFEGGYSHGGNEPFYPFPVDGGTPNSLAGLRRDAEVLRTEHGAVEGKWYFAPQDQTLLGFEVYLAKDEDPCEVYLSDYRPVDGRALPHRLEIRNGDKLFGVFTVKGYKLAAAK